MQPILITWRRLVDEEGRTCDRCGGTEQELDKAMVFLEKALMPLGIIFVLEKEALGHEEFARNPQQSNSILIDCQPLESWLAAEVGQSPCCGPCGDAECRTVTVEGMVYETIPAELIIKEALKAAVKKVQEHFPPGQEQPGRP